MPTNEFGEIIRSNNQTSNASDNSSESTNSRGDRSFATEVQNHFVAAKKRSFNLITLLIAVPLYSIIGYVLVQYCMNQGYQIDGLTNIVGSIIGAIIALVVTLTYNNIYAKKFDGSDYLVSLLSTTVVVIAIALAFFLIRIIVKIIVVILEVMFAILIVIAIIAGLAGG